MNEQTRVMLILASTIGAALIGVGLLLGFLPLSVAALDGTYHCGSAFSGDGYAQRTQVDQIASGDATAGSALVAGCDSKRSDRRTLAFALLVPGGLITLVSLGFIGDGYTKNELAKEEAARKLSEPPSSV